MAKLLEERRRGETGRDVKQLAAQLEELERKFDRRSGGSDRGGGGSPEDQGSPAVRNSQMRKAQTVGVEAARSTKMKKDFDWFKLCNQ